MALPNRINMDVFIPALLFSVLTDKAGEANLFSHLSLGVTLIILLSGLISWPLAKVLNIDFKTLSPPIMFGNAANLGLPLIVLAFGDDALAFAVVVFIVCNFFHVTIGSYLLDKNAHILKALTSPMLLATFLALSLNYFGVRVNEMILQPISMLGNICVPLMLFALGVRLIDTEFSEWRIGLLAGVMAPLCGVSIYFVLVPWLDLSKTQEGVLFLFSILPPAVMNYMFAEHFDQEPGRVASMVLFGNAIAILTIPLALTYALPKFT
jgi:malate permease and related proteins